MSVQDANLQRMYNQGATFGQRAKNNLINSILSSFTNSPSYYEVNINDSDLIGVQIFENGGKETLDTSKYIMRKPNEKLYIGDIIKWFSDYWLCLKTEKINNIYDLGIIMKCDVIIKFNNRAGTLLEIPCVINNKFTMTLDNGRYLAIPDNTCEILCSNNNTNSQIEIGNRFVLGIKVYQVTNIDDIHPIGILNIKMKLDDIMAEDDISNGIAIQNYKNKFINKPTLVDSTDNDSNSNIDNNTKSDGSLW
jgi:hypothetical protein